ncbi:MAG TPA: hypothetical protein DCS31_08375 [Candidatus Competibacteraceae bacterium]|jgi:hypothetical protein|nr:hypothetical protein [Candidatus Competibacteraceae bacterium]
MSTFLVTFGQRYRTEAHPTFGEFSSLPDGWVEVDALTHSEARDKVNSAIGATYSMIYTAENFSPELFPSGCLGKI